MGPNSFASYDTLRDVEDLFTRITDSSYDANAVFCLYVCFESHELFFSYLATVTITGERAANFDLCLALKAFNGEGSFTCHTYCDTGPIRKTRDSFI
jgi:hypothetical protein